MVDAVLRPRMLNKGIMNVVIKISRRIYSITFCDMGCRASGRKNITIANRYVGIIRG
jgi:hypothetical protein